STPSLSGDRQWNVLNCATARMYVSWVLGDKLRIVMSSIMRWRRGEIGLVIGGLLSVGLHERAILADKTPPTMIQLRLGWPTPKGIYGRRSLNHQNPPFSIGATNLTTGDYRGSGLVQWQFGISGRPDHSGLMPADF